MIIYSKSLRHLNSQGNVSFKNRTIEEMCRKKYMEYLNKDRTIKVLETLNQKNGET